MKIFIVSIIAFFVLVAVSCCMLSGEISRWEEEQEKLRPDREELNKNVEEHDSD